MGQNQGSRNPVGSYRDIDRLKEQKRQQSGLLGYKFPGELEESDHDQNGADVDENVCLNRKITTS